MTANRHVVVKLLTVSRMSKVNYPNKVLPNCIFKHEIIVVYTNVKHVVEYLVCKLC